MSLKSYLYFFITTLVGAYLFFSGMDYLRENNPAWHTTARELFRYFVITFMVIGGAVTIYYLKELPPSIKAHHASKPPPTRSDTLKLWFLTIGLLVLVIVLKYF